MNYLKKIFNRKNQNKRKQRFEPDPEDVFLVSYPKSGNTWLRFMIGNYLSDTPLDFNSIHEVVPDIHIKPEQIDGLNLPSPRFIKSHVPYESQYKDHKIVYVLRDGRDVAVSYYFQYLKFEQNKDLTFEDFLIKFHKGEVNYGTWNNHVKSWLDSNINRFHLTRYEDLKINPIGELIKILIFARIPIDYSKIVKAVASSDFKKMSEIEEKSQQYSPQLSTSNQELKFVREGKVKGYLEHFNQKSLEIFHQFQGEVLRRVGYEI